MCNFSGADLGIDSDGFFELEHQPKSVAVIGGGYIGKQKLDMYCMELIWENVEFHQSTDWSIDWLIAWLIVRLIDWLIDFCLIDWLIDLLVFIKCFSSSFDSRILGLCCAFFFFICRGGDLRNVQEFR